MEGDLLWEMQVKSPYHVSMASSWRMEAAFLEHPKVITLGGFQFFIEKSFLWTSFILQLISSQKVWLRSCFLIFNLSPQGLYFKDDPRA